MSGTIISEQTITAAFNPWMKHDFRLYMTEHPIYKIARIFPVPISIAWKKYLRSKDHYLYNAFGANCGAYLIAPAGEIGHSPGNPIVFSGREFLFFPQNHLNQQDRLVTDFGFFDPEFKILVLGP